MRQTPHPDHFTATVDPEDDDGKGGNESGGCGDGSGCGRR